MVDHRRMRWLLRVAGLSVLGLVWLGCTGPRAPLPAVARPNVLLVVADDLGYSDLGAYGSEIPTPNLDALAESGVLAADFYVSPRGVPTRAMLLTGVDHHLAGFGGVPERLTPEQEERTGSEGRLSRRVVTLATLLREAGYRTLMAGKWELGEAPEDDPAARGFERSFALLDAAASHWDDMKSATPGHERASYRLDGTPVEALPEGWFSTQGFTDFLIEALGAGDERPFFAYLAYQAPHGPLAVPEDWRGRSAGRYDEGYDAVRRRRLQRMQSATLVHEEVRPFPGIPTVPRWADLSEEQQRGQARRMELYAAMVENLDFHLGRLIEHLRETGAWDSTVVFFLSDNGAEPGDRGPAGMDERGRDWYAQQFPATQPEAWGGPDSFVEVGPAWAQVSMVPFRMFKGTQAEGGVRSPLLVSGPGVARGRRTHALLHVADVPATVLALAGASYPEEHRGVRLAPPAGRSLLPLLRRRTRLGEAGFRDWLGSELAGDAAVRTRRWKIVRMAPPFGSGQWQLFRIDRDPAELHDQAGPRPEKVQELLALWQQYAEGAGLAPDQKSSPSAR
jgi:arylsulfatase